MIRVFMSVGQTQGLIYPYSLKVNSLTMDLKILTRRQLYEYYKLLHLNFCENKHTSVGISFHTSKLIQQWFNIGVGRSFGFLWKGVCALRLLLILLLNWCEH